ncbi:MAG: T9SS type A sorting domain-containing protein, partial [Candidatus Moranbacteria bacterium]|nr:T9SS type A sorting domain-containing protein [Candidatus Moranbacteria bacterium]
IVTFAAANTNPSAIEAATNLNIPSLMFVGKNDCVTPPAQHQLPIFEATSSKQKILIDITGAGHCFFADYNLFCSIGESSCTPQPTISRQKQQEITLNLLGLYFDFILKGNQESWPIFIDALQSSNEIEHLIEWLSVDNQDIDFYQEFSIYPNPFKDSLNIELNSAITELSILVYDSSGRIIYQNRVSGNDKVEINTKRWPQGFYIVLVSSTNTIWRKKIIKE